MSTSRSPYKLPPGERDADKVTYNPMADDRVDSDEFDPEEDTERQPIGARGADNEPTRRHFAKEDMETARSDATGRIPKSEVAELVSSAGEDTSGLNPSGTRGIRVDAWKQDKEMDKMYVESGLADAVQDVEIKRGTGYSQ
ncbi:hypothetical protein PHLCEN_2v4962 [Hermanssonia centrifuga]|uniref:Uncharacterized protein n=1 Tax=Hermanssonia centrifuga TaxID=98765 RepID=A0A2R6PCF4_9APHY|nr:hypothetical protein PHLCEN_2v4962 [Hermanssonia centrifuga]